jgi:hypothetical protein|tara:strand:- start:5525 stop:5821 length:297 start_codon:yes stop_codon:yes gene_type:complete
MSDILKKYEQSTLDAIAKARSQSEGKQVVNDFDLDNTYSSNFAARTPGNKTVQLSNDPEASTGQFTEAARDYYDEELKQITDERFKKYNRNNKYLNNV